MAAGGGRRRRTLGGAGLLRDARTTDEARLKCAADASAGGES